MTTAGRFGIYGGAYVPETLVPAVEELEAAMNEALADPAFVAELDSWLRDYAGRPTPLTLARRLTADCAGAEIWLKREDLVHTGAHKLNNALGQVLLARRMGKTRIIAETGAGQHGVAVATVCACFGLECVVYMGREDTRRQAVNVYRMGLLGAEVRPVDSGSRTLKDATNEAIRDWVTNVHNTHYVIGSVVGPHPYPTLVKRFQRVIGDEARAAGAASAGGRSPTRWSPAWAGAATPSASSPPSSRTRTWSCSASRPPAAGSAPASTRRRWPRAGRASSTAPTATSSRTPTGRCARPTRSRPVSTTPGSVPSTPRCATRSAPATSPAPTRRRCAPSTGSAGWRGSSPPWSPATPWRSAERRARELGPGHRVLVCLSGRGDKDIDTVRAVGGAEVRRPMTAGRASGEVRGRLRGARRGRAARDHPLRHRRLPGARRHRAAPARLPAGGEPGGRGGHPLQRPAGRRPHHPERRLARPGAGDDPGSGHRPGGRGAGGRADHPGGGDDLHQPGARHGRRGLRRRLRRGRGRRGDRPRPPRRGGRRAGRGARRPRAGPHPPGGAHHPDLPGGPGRRHRRRLRLLRQRDRHHRRSRPGEPRGRSTCWTGCAR